MSKVQPIVSVCLQTYQHKNYIKKCLDGILMQEVKGKIEVLVGEDESTDGTREICVEYAKRYPEEVKLSLLSRKNVIYISGRPSGRFNMLNNLSKAKGKFVALCEGDDVWTNPHKLQKQIDFLEKHSDYAMVFHKIVDQYAEKKVKRFDNLQKNRFATGDLLKRGIIPTSTILFRNGLVKNFPNWFKKVYVGDWPLTILLSLHGDAYYLDKDFALSHRDGSGVWSGSNKGFRLTGKYNMYGILYKHLPMQYRPLISELQTGLIPAMALQSLNHRNLGEFTRLLLEFTRSPQRSKIVYFKKLIGSKSSIS